MAPKLKRLPILVLAAVALATVAGIALLIFRFLPRSSGQPAIHFDSTLPGIARAGYVYTDAAAIKLLDERSQSLLLQDAGWIRTLRIEGRLTGQPAEPSLILDALDQIAAARISLESGDTAALRTALARIRRVFRNDQGLLAGSATLDANGQATRSTGFSTAASLGWLRLLADSSQLVGTAELQADLRVGSDAFLALTAEDGLAPADTSLALIKTPPRADVEVTPTPRPSITPTPEIESVRPVIRIADLDLYAMKLLQPLDTRWQTVYERSLALVQGAVIDGPVPLFQYAYDPAIKDYIGFAGTQPVIGLEDSLLALLHICESGEKLPETLIWVRSRFYESAMLSEQVNRASGASASEDECVAGYAILARVARLAGDQMLYSRAVERLAWHTATSTRSVAYGAIFRTDSDDRIMVSAHDNLWARLAYQ